MSLILLKNFLILCIRVEINTSTRWSEGVYVPFLGYYVKCSCEYFKADEYLKLFNNSNLTIDEFYKHIYDN
jgi:hypothetical protein